MSGRYFLDTNIFVYAFDATSRAKQRRAISLIRDAAETRTGVVSYQVVQEFFNVSLRKFAEPMSTSDAEQYLWTVFRPLLTVNSSAALMSDALRIAGRYRLNWYDSLIVASAREANCTLLYTEDLQHGFEIDGLKIVDPFR
jgi:predicted nucleic acid-binding protein